MASVSASHLIIFVASLVIAAGVVGTLTTGVERVSSSIDDGSLDVSQQIRMDMSVVSDSGADFEAGNALTIHVRNTGSQRVPIDPSQFDVVLNGEFIPNDQLDIEDANDPDEGTWQPNHVVSITIGDEGEQENLKEDGDNRLVLTVNDKQETFEFHAEEA